MAGTEADVRATDAARAADAYEREHRRRLDGLLTLVGEPPPDVD